MKDIKIIGDEIYYDNVLVAKLVKSPRHTTQGEFIDVFKKFIRWFEN
jgi:hypothetical protein